MITPAIFRIAVDALTANKLRSGLTLLGIVVGVTSVMTIISALEGMNQSISDMFSRMGPTTFVVERMGMVLSDEDWWERQKRKPLKPELIPAIARGCDNCDKISPRASQSESVTYRGTKLRDVLIRGVSASYISIVNVEVAQGRFHSTEEDLHSSRVAYIGETVRQTFFEGIDPIGKEIRVGDTKYLVIGVGQKLGSVMGEDQDKYIMVPYTAWRKQYGAQTRRFGMFVTSKTIDQLPDAMDEVRQILRAERRVPFNKPDDFELVTAEAALDLWNQFTRILRMGLIGISSISVIIGGIVVMNIMMVSVSERTREIGIRKSLGAKKWHIGVQFLFESLLLTVSGGLIGILAGYAIAKSLVAAIDMQMSPSTLAIIVGVTISTAIGLVFGIYPAMKAARLDPIKALSYE